MLSKIFGKKIDDENKVYSEAEKQNLSVQFIRGYIVDSQNEAKEIAKNVIDPLSAGVKKETRIKKYSGLAQDIKRGQYNNKSLGIYSGMLIKDLKEEGKDKVYEDLAVNLAADTLLADNNDKQLTRKQETLQSQASRLMEAYGTSVEKIQQERIDRNLAEHLQEELRKEEQQDIGWAKIVSRQSARVRRRANREPEEEKREIEALPESQYHPQYQTNYNVERYVPEQQMSDEQLARQLQEEEDRKSSTSFAQQVNSDSANNNNHRNYTPSETEHVSQILRERALQSQRTHDMWDTMPM